MRSVAPYVSTGHLQVQLVSYVITYNTTGGLSDVIQSILDLADSLTSLPYCLGKLSLSSVAMALHEQEIVRHTLLPLSTSNSSPVSKDCKARSLLCDQLWGKNKVNRCEGKETATNHYLEVVLRLRSLPVKWSNCFVPSTLGWNKHSIYK